MSGHGGLFLRAATQILPSSWNAPWALYMAPEQAAKVAVYKEAELWGCPISNFKATLPFHEMRVTTQSIKLFTWPSKKKGHGTFLK